MNKMIYLIIPFLVMSALSKASEISLMDALKTAEKSSPKLKSAHFKSQALKKEISVQQSPYLPELDLAAVASTGAPGSFAFGGVDNNISSTDRIGSGAAFVLKQDIWDFGRTSNSVRLAEDTETLQKKQFSVDQMDLDRQILETYVQCAYLKSQVSDSKFLADQARMMAREINRFVASGQKSVIEKYLVDAAQKEAETKVAEFSERATVTEQRLAIEMGVTVNTHFSCVPLEKVEPSLKDLEAQKNSGLNPVIEVQKAKIKMAQSKLDQVKDGNMPVLVGIATGGYFDNAQIPNRFNYSAGVGLSLPIFEGFRVDSAVQREAADLKVEEALLEYSNQSMDSLNSKYDEQIRSLSIRLSLLKDETELAHKALNLAKKRYLSLQGTIIDVREAISNMTRVLESENQASRDVFIARGEKVLLSGASVGANE